MNTPRPRTSHGIASGLCEVDQALRTWGVSMLAGGGDASKMETRRLTGEGEESLDPGPWTASQS